MKGVNMAIGAAALACAGQANASITVFETEPNNSYSAPQIVPFKLYDNVTIVGNVFESVNGIFDYYAFDPPSEAEARNVDVTLTLDADVPGLTLYYFIPRNPNFPVSNSSNVISVGSIDQVRTVFAVGRTAGTTPGGYRLTLTGVVPEPATWALMLTGFAMAGYALRRRRAGVAIA